MGAEGLPDPAGKTFGGFVSLHGDTLQAEKAKVLIEKGLFLSLVGDRCAIGPEKAGSQPVFL